MSSQELVGDALEADTYSCEPVTDTLEADNHPSKDESANETCSTCLAYKQEGRLKFPSGVATSAVVHQACLECDAFKIDESQLCDFCIHVRPAHFMTCRSLLDLYNNRELKSQVRKFEIKIGKIDELKSRQARCAFCRWCLEVVQVSARSSQDIEETEAINIIREITSDKRRRPFDRDHKPYTSVCAKTKPSCGEYLGTKSTYIGHNKKYVRSFGASGDEILVDLRRNNPLITPVIHWATANRWLSRCMQHETCSERAAGKLPEHFRLIDVAKKRIINVDKDPPSFFALSYVWGADPEDQTMLRRSNMDELQKPGSLNSLPRTIADAMHVCELLDQSFLWVDRLCIIQDDKEDKYGQIRSLEAIYTRAELVIIAACGNDMQSGLAGVDVESPRNKRQISTDVFGFTIASKLPDFHDALPETKWNERGWTYQEAVLARRKLYFTPAELWFECTEGLKRENRLSATWYKPQRGNHLISYVSRDAQSSSDVFEEYGHHVTQYSRRTLTYPSDIYNAFHGIEDAFYPECQTIFGLPESDFSRALLWSLTPLIYHPELQERQCSDRDIVLPSWSWASLKGEVTNCDLFDSTRALLGDKFHFGSFYCSICSWATLAEDDQQTLRPINSIHDEEVWKKLDKLWLDDGDFRHHPTHRQFLALAWAKGCIEADVPTDLFQKDFSPRQLQPSSIISAQDLALRWPTIHDFWADVSNGKHDRRDRPVPLGFDTGHLLTRAQSSIMTVEIKSGPERRLIRHAHTHSGNDDIVGWISSIDEYELRGTTPERVADVDFIALAVGYMPQIKAASILDKETRKQNSFSKKSDFKYYDETLWIYRGYHSEDFFEDQPGVIVMAVKWTGPVARRIALGWVTLQGWVDSKPEFRTVILA